MPTTTASLRPPPLVLDGSVHEGGGQVVRNALALAACTSNRSLTITSIRAGRPKPGLRAQHVAGLRLVAELSAGAALAGCDVGSTRLDFTPGVLTTGSHVADAATAGSTMLMAQAALPAALLAGCGGGGGASSSPSATSTSTLDLRGGTDASMAPPADYAALVLLPTLRRVCGVEVDLAILRRGFFPKGGGHVRLTARALEAGRALAPLVLVRGPDDAIASITVTAGHAGRVTASAVQAAVDALLASLRTGLSTNLPVVLPSTTITPWPPTAALGDGGSITAVATTASGLVFGASAPLTPKDDPAILGTRLGAELAEDVGGGHSTSSSALPSVDRWLADQVVIFAALAGGVSRWTTVGAPTLHALAAMEVATAVTGAVFTVSQVTGGCWTVECVGAGIPAGGQRERESRR